MSLSVRLHGDRTKARAMAEAHVNRLIREFRNLNAFQNLQQNARRIDMYDGENLAGWILLKTVFGVETVEVYAVPSVSKTVREIPTQTFPPKCLISFALVSNAVVYFTIIPKDGAGTLYGRGNSVAGIHKPVSLESGFGEGKRWTWPGSSEWLSLGPDVYYPETQAEKEAEYEAYQKYYDGLNLHEYLITERASSLDLSWGAMKRALSLSVGNIHHHMRDIWLGDFRDATETSVLRESLAASSLEWESFFNGQDPSTRYEAPLSDYYDIWAGYIEDPNAVMTDGSWYYRPRSDKVQPTRPLEFEFTCSFESTNVQGPFSGTLFEFSPEARHLKFSAQLPGRGFGDCFFGSLSFTDEQVKASENWHHLARVDVKGRSVTPINAVEVSYKDNIVATSAASMGQSADPALGIAVYPYE